MRQIITITTLLLLAACTYDKRDSDGVAVSATTDKESKTNLQSTKDNLVGQWGIYNTSDGAMTTYCNACPTIIFYESGTATIKYPNGTNETIKWTKEKQRLTIINVTNKNKTGEFADGQYSLTFGNKGGLEIKEIGTSYTYGLNRHEGNWR